MNHNRSYTSTGKILFFAIVAVLLVNSASARSQRIVFPRDPAVLNAKIDMGARGDGVTDDTDALQKGLDASSGLDGKPTRVLYLPNGVYRVTRTLVIKATLGPWLYGETRDGAIIRLDDGVLKCNSVLRTHPNESGSTSADWFMRNLRNFTIDVGNNPNTDGIRYFANNSGIIKNVHVKGNGKIGINAGFLGESGPNLIQDTLIEGFETGIVSQWIWGETLSRITIRNCRKLGIYVSANAVGIEGLVVQNTPQALFCDYPNDWTWWGGVVALLGGNFATNTPAGPAINNRNVLYARDVTTKGYASALQSSTLGGNIPGYGILEYSSHDVKKLFDAPPASLKLPVKSEPDIPWEANLKNWVCVNDYRAIPGDNQDDTAAFQKAIDAAAAAGRTTVMIRGIGGGDPNWFNINGEVHIHGSVRSILALGFGRILGGLAGRFVVDDSSAPVVKFQNIDSFGGTPVTLENRSKSNAMVVESCGVHILGTGLGDIFATDCPATVDLQYPKQKMWARQLNPEGDSDSGLVKNAGADLWVLGMKCEGRGVRALTRMGGRTEIAGIFNYGPGIDTTDLRPMFDIQNASTCLLGLREISFGNVYPIKVRETRGGVTRTLGSDREGGWIGWSLYSGYNDPTYAYPPTHGKAVGGVRQIRLAWDAMPGATGYILRSGSAPAGPFTTLATVATNTYVHTGLKQPQTLYYTISAIYRYGGSAPTQPIRGTTGVAYRINCGGQGAGPFDADNYFSGGNSSVFGSPMDVTGVTAPAPQEVYQSERWGTFTYTFSDLTPGAKYRIRLHFAEGFWNAPGKRIFNVAINGTTVLSNFDVLAAAGGQNKAIVREFTALADSKGNMAIAYLPVQDAPKASGIELLTP